MDTTTLWVLLGTAVSIGVVHTLIGTDHYLPIIVLSRARKWTQNKTLWITFWCGLGHVFSSILLGAVGIALGLAVSHLEGVEGARGNLASWLLIAFGLAYLVWGLRCGWKGKVHSHQHVHPDGSVHRHEHAHEFEHCHIHQDTKPITPWALFIIFVLGPCEPLIPLLMYPASDHSWGGCCLRSRNHCDHDGGRCPSISGFNISKIGLS